MEPDHEGGDLLSGRYEIGPLLGLGGSAQVHRAWDHRDDHAVAVKIFRLGAAPVSGRGGTHELEVLAGVSHPGLVGIHDSGVDAHGCPFVVMDLVDGHSLAARLHDGPLTPAAATELGTVLAEALDAVHTRGIVHRDVKPANVLLDADGLPRLTDFGIARIVDATRVTATGMVIGTAAYMAPEQVRGESVGPAADVYALGLVLLETVTGRREYDGGPLESALARLHRAPVIPADLPDPLAATLSRMVATDPDARPGAAEVAASLRDRHGAAPRTPSRRIVPVAALACLLVAALAGTLTLVGRTPSTAAPTSAEAGVAAPPAVVLALPPVAELPAVEAPRDPAPAQEADPPRPVPVALTRGDRAPDPRAGATSGSSARGNRTASDEAPASARHRGGDDRDDDGADDERDDRAGRRDDRDDRDDEAGKKSDKAKKAHGKGRSDDRGKGSGDDDRSDSRKD